MSPGAGQTFSSSRPDAGPNLTTLFLRVLHQEVHHQLALVFVELGTREHTLGDTAPALRPCAMRRPEGTLRVVVSGSASGQPLGSSLPRILNGFYRHSARRMIGSVISACSDVLPIHCVGASITCYWRCVDATETVSSKCLILLCDRSFPRL